LNKWLIIYEDFNGSSYKKNFMICSCEDDVTYQKDRLPNGGYFIEAYELTGKRLKNKTVLTKEVMH